MFIGCGVSKFTVVMFVVLNSIQVESSVHFYHLCLIVSNGSFSIDLLKQISVPCLPLVYYLYELRYRVKCPEKMIYPKVFL